MAILDLRRRDPSCRLRKREQQSGLIRMLLRKLGYQKISCVALKGEKLAKVHALQGGWRGRTVFSKPAKTRRGGEESSVQALLDLTELLLCCSESGHLTMTRHSITSSIISAEG